MGKGKQAFGLGETQVGAPLGRDLDYRVVPCDDTLPGVFNETNNESFVLEHFQQFALPGYDDPYPSIVNDFSLKFGHRKFFALGGLQGPYLLFELIQVFCNQFCVRQGLSCCRQPS